MSTLPHPLLTKLALLRSVCLSPPARGHTTYSRLAAVVKTNLYGFVVCVEYITATRRGFAESIPQKHKKVQIIRARAQERQLLGRDIDREAQTESESESERQG